MVGVSLTTVDEWYEKWLGGALAAGVIATLGFARRLMQAPISVVGQAIGVAVLPALSRLWSEGRGEELDRVLSGALRAAIGLGLLAAAFLFAFAEPIVELLYEHGRFTASDSERVASVLVVMSFAVVGWVTQQVGVRAFYARGEMWRPMLLGTAIALTSFPLYVMLGRSHGAEGIAAAGALGMSVNAVVTVTWARARFGGPLLRPLLEAAARATVIAVPAAWIARLLAPEGVGRLASLTELGVGLLVFGALAGAGLAAIGDEATRASALQVLRRLGLGGKAR
jgi:putative peptidoglycan lipid II flippase